MAEAALDLQKAIQDDLQELRISQDTKISREQYREIQNFNPAC
ncbi:hypothetical protein PQG02_25075 [Nostoc sp. UHCC 0926]|nr:hypothetical protein PQG02_25075 [Nostoc sp. UHCC 0926]